MLIKHKSVIILPIPIKMAKCFSRRALYIAILYNVLHVHVDKTRSLQTHDIVIRIELQVQQSTKNIWIRAPTESTRNYQNQNNKT